MGLTANFEETPTLLAPPSYLDSTTGNGHEPHSNTQWRQIDIAPRYTAWRLIFTAFLGPSGNTSLGDLDREEEQAAAFYEILCNVRLTSRLLYSVSMSLLRPIYFPDYLRAIQATVYSTNLKIQNLDRPCRETRVLDHYISYRIHRRHIASRSLLLLNNDDPESDYRQVSQDLFKWLQPQTFIEDEIGKELRASARPTNRIEFRDLLVRFQFTRATVTLPFVVDSSSARSSASAPTIVRKGCTTVQRASNESVFLTVRKLLDQLNRLVFVRKAHGDKAWYELVGETS